MIAIRRALLAIALLVGLCLIPAALVFAALFLLPFSNYIATGSPAPSVYYLILMMPGLWALLYMVFMMLGVTGTPRDTSVLVRRDEDPGRLWARVDDLARRVGTRPPAELRLTAEPNAAVVEETRWLGLIPVTRRMYFGVPLLYTLPPAQLDAVICHELGHYARGHTRAGALCHRAHVAATLMVDGLKVVRARRGLAGRRRVVNRVVSEVHFRLVRRYTEVYRRLSAATARSQEFQADAKAAEIAGAETIADALRAAHAVTAGWETFTKSRTGLLHLAGDTSDPFTEFRDEWKDPVFRWNATVEALDAAGKEHEPLDTHPPLDERLARILPGLAQTHGAVSRFPAPPPENVPRIPLDAGELIRLFDEADIRRRRKTPSEPVPHVPAPKGMKAVLGLLLRLLGSHPFAAAAAAVVVLSGSVSGVYEGHRHARPYGAFVPTVDLGSTLPSVNPLAVELTGYLQSKNESGFLSLAAPAARKAMQSWWANQQAMGFTTGAVVPASTADTRVQVDSAGDGTATVLAGTHNPLDPADGVLVPPVVPSAQYRLGLHFSPGAGPESVAQITSWTPLGDAPWDQGTALSVRKSAHVEVVGGPADGDLVSQTLPLAETAAAYDLAFTSHVDPMPLNDQTGFVVFVCASASERDRWFRSGPQPKQQTGDADGGVTHLLQGPSDGHIFDMLAKVDLAFVSGGARVVVTPYQQAGETPQEETSVLVREMIHASVMSFEPSDKDVQPWANEGIASVIADLYRADGNPVPASYDLRQVIAQVRALPGNYRTGTLPDAQQLYGGTAASRADWDTVAASVYAYIAETYGISTMLGSADALGSTAAQPDAHSGPDTPFGHVFKSDNNGEITYYPAAAISSGWKTWLQDPR